MNSNPLVSIIVPVYNVENYLNECIDSILAQTYKNFELYLVDDGSPDNCGTICEEYAKKDDRIKVIHKQNGGLSDARNAGIDKAKGDYITFVDSDDYVSPMYVSHMLRLSEQYDAEIVQIESTHDEALLGNYKNSRRDIYKFNRNDALKNMLYMRIVQVNAWGKLYRTSLFNDVQYPFGRINEDNLTTYKLIWKSKMIVCDSQFLYYYRINQKGIMNGKFSDNRYSVLSFKDEINAYLGTKASEFYDAINYCEMRLAIRIYNECIEKNKDGIYTSNQNYVYELLKEIDVNKVKIDMKYKLLLKILFMNRTLYRILVKSLR